MNISYFSTSSFSHSSNTSFIFVRKIMIKIGVLFFLFALTTPLTAYAQPDNLASSSSIAKVNINTADMEELASRLFGVGESKAQAIVEYREKMGSFKSVNDLILVRGIGEKTLTENRHLLVLSND